MPHKNDRSWTSPKGVNFHSYGNPQSSSSFFAENLQDSPAESNINRNLASHDHWSTILNEDVERAPKPRQRAMSPKVTQSSSPAKREAAEAPDQTTRPGPSNTGSAALNGPVQASNDSDFTPRLPVMPPAPDEPPTPPSSAVQSPTCARAPPGLTQLSENLNAWRTFQASRSIAQREGQDPTALATTSGTSGHRSALPARSTTEQSSYGGQHTSSNANRDPFNVRNAHAGSTMPGIYESRAASRLRYNPTAEFTPRASLNQNHMDSRITDHYFESSGFSTPRAQSGHGYAMMGTNFGARRSAGNTGAPSAWNGRMFDLDLRANLQDTSNANDAHKVDDLTSNFGGVCLTRSTSTNPADPTQTTPPNSRGSSGSTSSSGARMATGWNMWQQSFANAPGQQQAHPSNQLTYAHGGYGNGSPPSDRQVPDHEFHDFAATLRANFDQINADAHGQHPAGPNSIGQAFRQENAMQDGNANLSYRFADFADPRRDGPLFTEESVYLIAEFKLHRSEIFQIAPEYGMWDLLKRSELFVLVDADRGYDIGQVVMASNNLVEARADRKDRYRRHWNALIDLSNQQHWCYQDKATREENFEGYYSHMSNQPLTSSYAGGQTPPSIVSIVSPCVVDDLRFKEAGETKAKRRCAEAANAIPNLDCEVVGAEYQLDCQKLTVYYISNRYIDYKELSHSLYKTFKTRLWFVALNPASFYPSARPASYDRRLLVPRAQQHNLQPGDSQFYAAPSFACPTALSQSSIHSGTSYFGFTNAPMPSFNCGGSSAISYSSQVGTNDSNSLAYGETVQPRSVANDNPSRFDGRSMSFGSGASSPFGSGVPLTPAFNGRSHRPSFGQNNYFSSATSSASYYQPHAQREQSGVTRDFGPIGSRNRQ